mgnify:CR=1 FL=1
MIYISQTGRSIIAQLEYSVRGLFCQTTPWIEQMQRTKRKEGEKKQKKKNSFESRVVMFDVITTFHNP